MFEKLLVEWSMTEDAQKILGKHDESQDWALLAFASWLDSRGRTTHETDKPHTCPSCKQSGGHLYLCPHFAEGFANSESGQV